MHSVRHTRLGLWLLPVLCACSSAGKRDNPYDDKAPASLQARGTVAGTVVLEGMTDAQSISVSLIGSESYTTLTNAAGEFSLGGVASGSYRLSIEPVGFRALHRDSITVAIGASVDLGRLVLEAARGTLVGRLAAGSNPEHTSLGGALISIKPIAATSKQATPGSNPAANRATTSGADGSFTLPDVPVGSYSLAVSRDDLSEICLPDLVLAEDGETYEIPVIMIYNASALLRVVDAVGNIVTATANPDVTVEIVSFGAAGLRYAQAPGDLAAASYAPMVASFETTLTGADGDKTLYVQFLDGCQNPSRTYTATVVLDREPPQDVAVAIADGAAYLTAADGQAAIAFFATDAHAGIASLQLTVDGSDPTAAERRDFVTTAVLPLGVTEGLKTVRAVFVDRAGNVSEEATDTILKDSVAPTLTEPALTIVPQGGFAVQLKFGVDPDDAASVAISNFAGTEAGPFVPFATMMPWTLAQGGDGPRQVFARFRDAAMNTTDEVSAQLVMDLSPPQAPLVVIEGDLDTTHKTTGITLALDVSDGSPGTQVLLSNCPDFCAGSGCDACCNTLGNWEPLTPTVNTWSFAGCNDGLMVVYAKFKDASANVSAVAHDAITLDTARPVIDSFTISQGDQAVRSVSVDLMVKASDNGANALSVAFVNRDISEPCSAALFAGASYQPLAAVSTFLLTSGDGRKAVCARVRDGAGNESTPSDATCADESEVVTDCESAFLDTRLPEPPRLEERDTITSLLTFSVNVLDAPTDPAPSSGGLHFELRGGAYEDWTDAPQGTLSFTFDLLENAQNRLAVRVVDAASNASSPAEVVVVNDSEGPLAPYLTGVVSRLGTLSVSWLPSAAADVDHFLLYYGNFPGQYTGRFAVEGPSPLVVNGSERNTRLSGISDQASVYLAMSAVDKGGLEGPLSGEAQSVMGDVAPRFLGFVGGSIVDAALEGERAYLRTTLGINSFDITDPSAVSFAPSVFMPLDRSAYASDPTAVPSQFAVQDGELFVLSATGVSRLREYVVDGRPQYVSTGFVAFASARLYTAFALRKVGAETLLYLGGPERVAIYDVTAGRTPTLRGQLQGIANLTPNLLSYQEHDFGSGAVSLLWAASPTSSEPLQLFDVTQPTAITLLGASTTHATTFFGNRAFYDNGWRAMSTHIGAVTFDGMDMSDDGLYHNTPENFSTGANAVVAIRQLKSGNTTLDALVYVTTLSANSVLRVIDIAVPSTPRTFGEATFTAAGGLKAIRGDGERVMVATGFGVHFFSTQADQSLLEVGSLPAFSSAAPRTDVYNNTQALFVHDGDVVMTGLDTEEWGNASHLNWMRLDMADPAQPRLKSSHSFRNTLFSDLMRVGKHAVVTYSQSAKNYNSAYPLAIGLVDLDTGALTPATLPYSDLTYFGLASDGHTFVGGTSSYDGYTKPGTIDLLAFTTHPAPATLSHRALCSLQGVASSTSPMMAFAKSRVRGALYGLLYDHSEGLEAHFSLQRCVDDGNTSCTCTELVELANLGNPHEIIYTEPYLFYLDADTLVSRRVDPTTGANQRLSSMSFAGAPFKMLEIANYLIVLTHTGTYLVDVSNPEALRLAGNLTPGLACEDAAVEGTRLYCLGDGLVVFDLIHGDTPRLAGTLFSDTARSDFSVQGQAAVGLETGALKAYRINDMQTPMLVGEESEIDFNYPKCVGPFEVFGSEIYVGDLALCDWDTFPNVVERDYQEFHANADWYPSINRYATWDNLIGSNSYLFYAHDGVIDRLPVPMSGGIPAPDLTISGVDIPWVGTTLLFYGLVKDLQAQRLYALARKAFSNDYYLAVFNPVTGAYVGHIWFGSSRPYDGAWGLCGETARISCLAMRFGNDNRIAMYNVVNPANPVYLWSLYESAWGGQSCYDETLCRGRLQMSYPYQNPAKSRMYVTSRANGLSIWSLTDDLSALKLGVVNDIATGYDGLFVDDLLSRIVVGGHDKVDIYNVADDSAPVRSNRIHYPGLGWAKNMRHYGQKLFFQLDGDGGNGQIRAISKVRTSNFDYDDATDAGGRDELDAPQRLVQNGWTYYTSGQHRPGTSSQGVGDANVGTFELGDYTTPGAKAFKITYLDQYTPAGTVFDVAVSPGRIYVCRAQNPDEQNHGFEILQKGASLTRPTKIGGASVPCQRLAIFGELAWAVAYDYSADTLTVTTLSLTDEANPAVLGAPLTLPMELTDLESIVALGAYDQNAYAAIGHRGVYTFRLDRSGQPEFLEQIAPIQAGQAMSGLAVSGDRLYVSEAPGYFAVYTLDGEGHATPSASLSGAFGSLDMDGVLGYLTPDHGGTRIIDLR